MLDMGAMLRFTILLNKLVCLGMFCYPAISDNFLGWEKNESTETEAESQLPSQSVGKDFGKAKGLVL